MIFPIYITVVNSLLRPVDITRQPPKLFPTDPQWQQLQRRVERRAHGHLPEEQLHRHRSSSRSGRCSPPSSPGYAFAFLDFPFKRTLFVVFLATLMVPFEVTIVTNVTTISDLGWYNTYAGPGGAVPRHRLRRVPHAPGVPDPAARPARRGRPRRLRALALPVAGGGAAGAPGGRARSPCSRSSRRGTSTSGRCSSPRTTSCVRCRSVSSSCSQSSIDQVNITFAGAIIAVIPLVILLLFFQKQLVRGLTAGAVKG